MIKALPLLLCSLAVGAIAIKSPNYYLNLAQFSFIVAAVWYTHKDLNKK